LEEGGILTVSTNDTTILAVLSRYPGMPAHEADEYISKIEQQENVPVCQAVIGRINKEDLDESSLRTFQEFQRWSNDRTRRVRNEEVFSRLRKKETRTALAMNRLHQKGLISDSVLLMYGISGDLPEMGVYSTLSAEEKNALWQERMERRLGPNWSNRFHSDIPLPRIMSCESVNWRKEGF
jgi:hypothetical protein